MSNELWGVWRIPNYAGIMRSYSITDASFLSFNFWNGLSQTFSKDIESGERIIGIVFSATPGNSNGVTGSATRPRITILVNGIVVASYSLPKQGSDTADWRVQDTIAQNTVCFGAGNNVQVKLEAEAVGGNGYTLYNKCDIITIKI